MSIRRTEIALVVVPLLLVALSFWMMGVRGSYDLGLNIDPDFQYLFNAVRLASGSPSVYVHHPGTPLQIVAAVVIRAKWVLDGFSGGWPPFPEAVLADPTGYLRAVNLALVAMLAAVSLLAGWRVYRVSGSLPVALAVQLTPLVYLPAIESLPRVAPELPEFIVGMALVIPLAPILFGRDSLQAALSPRLAIAAGAVLGVGIATKANFFTVGLLVFLFPGWKQKARFAGACGATFLVLLAPIMTELGQMYEWFVNMATHSGHYGEGEAGLPGLSEYVANLWRFAANERFLGWFTLFYIVVIAAMFLTGRIRSSEQTRAGQRLLILGVAVILFHALVTAKHYNYHYVLPAAMVTVLLNGVVVRFLETWSGSGRWRIVLLAAGLLLGWEALQSSYDRMNWYAGWKAESKQINALVAEKRREQGNCRTIGYFRSSEDTFALALGNSLSGFALQTFLEKLYPGQTHYISGEPRHWNHQSALEEVRAQVSEGACVLLQGELTHPPTLQGLEVQPVFVPEQQVHGAEALYRLTLPGIP